MAAKELIQTVTVGAGGAASIDFTSIPQTGTDLLVVVSARGSLSGYVWDNVWVKPNGSSTNGSFRLLQGDGSNASSQNGTTTAANSLGNGNSSTTNVFGSSTWYFPNYTSANNKSISVDYVTENNSSLAYQGITAGLWASSAAITSLTFWLPNGTNFMQYSTASLYTITKGSGGATVA